MRLSFKLTITSMVASIFVLAMPLAPVTFTSGIHAGTALADSRDNGHAKHDKGKQDATSGYCD